MIRTARYFSGFSGMTGQALSLKQTSMPLGQLSAFLLTAKRG